MPIIRTTLEPWREITVSDGEYLWLIRQGLVYTGEPVMPPPTFTDAQYAELANPQGEAAQRVLAAALALVDESAVASSVASTALATIGPEVDAMTAAASDAIEGSVTVATAAKDAAIEARLQAETFAAATVALQDTSVWTLLTGPSDTHDLVNVWLDEKVDRSVLPTYVRDHGAVGDGVTDDTAAITAAIAAAGVGGRLVFSKGDYKTGPLTALAHQTWEGVTQFLGTGGSPSTRLRFNGLTGAQVGVTGGANNTFLNLLFVGPGPTVGTVTGVKTNSGSPRFTNCGFYSWVFGNSLTGAYYSTFRDCEWSYNAYGVSLTGAFNVAVFSPRFNCADSGLTTFGSAFSGAARALNIFGGSIENYGAGGAIRPASVQAVNIFGVYFESGNGANGGAIGVLAGVRDKVSVTMEGCFIYLTEHNRFVDLSGATESSLHATGNRYICSMASSTTPIAYVLGSSPTSDVVLEGDHWREMAKGTYISPIASFTDGGIAGVDVRFPAGYATHGAREFIGRDVIVDNTHTIRPGGGLTAARPVATTVQAGAMWYDKTLGKPIWSDGAVWKDATGTAV